MNQEPNNLNPNNFNIQGNTGMPNNQPLNNQNIGANQQPMIQDPTSQPMNTTLENGNTSNQDFNSKPPKKMNLGLIIGIIAFVAVIGIILSTVVIPKNKSNNNTNEDSKNKHDSCEIVHFDVSAAKGLIALTKSGQLYATGRFEAYRDFPSLTLLADNVKEFKYGNGIYYLDNNDILYRTGWDYKGGINDEIVKTYEDVSTYIGYFALLVVDKNNDLYIDSGLFPESSGIPEKTKGFIKVASNVKQPIIGFYFNGYIDMNNNLYIQGNSKEYELILKNVVSNNTSNYYLTSTNELYIYKFESGKTTDDLILQQVSTDVIELGEGFIKKQDDNYYLINSWYGYEEVLLDFSSDIKNILYIVSPRAYNTKLIYLNHDNKIVLYEKDKTSKTIDNNIDSLEQIYKFLWPDE